MSKVITLRLSEEEYKLIHKKADIEFRPISNYITSVVLRNIEESSNVDAVEMAQINNDPILQKKLKAGYKDAKSMKGKYVGLPCPRAK
ncbi:MAG: hypothetical protein A2452_05915 [Candidatus Firestonebacteria bacterium RIFOXYC2_FULL_39_67]|nr:MAG: hypothetical protein A2536_12550 [Candidatus Firestonebacteria bacterium RIFOXYD2_FULL_39_29]OGF56625.1 MAG: hypothetical protein A2452_05915 [Candidatus Firestonebacteria bacterium RIFOXYC2_FULL_39_67]